MNALKSRFPILMALHAYFGAWYWAWPAGLGEQKLDLHRPVVLAGLLRMNATRQNHAPLRETGLAANRRAFSKLGLGRKRLVICPA